MQHPLASAGELLCKMIGKLSIVALSRPCDGEGGGNDIAGVRVGVATATRQQIHLKYRHKNEDMRTMDKKITKIKKDEATDG